MFIQLTASSFPIAELEERLFKKFEALELERQSVREQQLHHRLHAEPHHSSSISQTYSFHNAHRVTGLAEQPPRRGGHSSNPIGREQHQVIQYTSPPEGYICKLCYVSGHWMRQCALFKSHDNNNMSSSQQPYNAIKRGFAKPRTPQQYHSGGIYNQGRGESFRVFATRNHHHQPGPNTVPPENYVCHKCSLPGHWIQNCPSQEKWAPPAGYICRICSIEGHYIKDCGVKNRETLTYGSVLMSKNVSYIIKDPQRLAILL
ncbi:hypothetical protein SeMB42_g05895 [Synchytrium endobioticum]|uniref:CCHC-type domain-containing protein n=1 Tax=Synchytrium endobioticum TaxID=286115 RepID=A0A507CNU2_9FUNG|nr:hypothetical protein SeMB42_g05895 [Synchytrium endobioticum]